MIAPAHALAAVKIIDAWRPDEDLPEDLVVRPARLMPAAARLAAAEGPVFRDRDLIAERRGEADEIVRRLAAPGNNFRLRNLLPQDELALRHSEIGKGRAGVWQSEFGFPIFERIVSRILGA